MILAQQYGVAEEFVQDVAARALAREQDRQLPKFKERQVGTAPRHILEAWATRLWAFVLVTTVLSIGTLQLILGNNRVEKLLPSQLRIGLVIFALTAVFSQFYCAYVQARARRGVLTSLAFMVCSVPFFVIEFAPFHFKWTGFIQAIGVGVPHIFFAVPAAIAGAYQKTRRIEQFDQSLDRQGLLERLFVLRERYRHAVSAGGSEASVAWWHGKTVPLARVVAVSAGVGMLLAIIMNLGWSIVDPTGQILAGSPRAPDPGALILVLAITIAAFAIQLGIAFWAGTALRGVCAMIAYALASSAVAFLPIGALAVRQAQTQSLWSVLGGLAGSIVIGAIGGLGAQAEARRDWSQRLTAGDPNALLGELVILECRLRPQAKAVCVLVIDAVRSSFMKAEADPFEAEWSFREYQSWIAQVASHHLGEVHSTAGDGAVIGFPTAQHAYAAAQGLQSGIADFNRDRSLLRHAFRVRIGLHSGAIADTLDKIQYTEVIDIAAHVEKAAPVGGICLSEPVRNELGMYYLSPQNELVDNYRVYVASGTTFQL